VQRGRVSSLTTLIPLFPQTLQRECAHLCNVDQHLLTSFSPFFSSSGSVPICAKWMVTSFRNPFSCRERARLCNVDQPLLSTPSRDVSVPACATWTGTSSRPSLPSSDSLTHPDDGTSVGGIDSPRDPHRASRTVLRRKLVPRVLRLAPRLASRDVRPATCAVPYVPRPACASRSATRTASCDMRRTLRPALRSRCNLNSPATSFPTFPCVFYIISMNRANSCKH
jgi:hypothetical protein